MSQPNISAESLDKLRQHDTPTVCNVIELFDVRPRHCGYMDQRIRSCFPEMPPIVGFAATATVRAAAPALDDPITIKDQIERFDELPGPPVMVFQDLDDPPAAATFGDIMCTAYQRFGAAGLITSGAARDLDQVRALGFPVFSGGNNPSHGYWHIPAAHVPVRVGGVTVNPGDMIHADCNGVTTIPIDIANDVADLCGEYAQAEGIILQYLNSGSITLAGMADAQTQCRDRFQDLRERVSASNK
ncbi:MAG: dimethylmenaquinone methyltransferase [Planctomycetaceae bacterium]|nr:dimethylmenaquinone methyltransferase [Planctomycetaceae bacterium]